MVTGGEVDCRVARWEARRPVRNSSHVTDQGVHMLAQTRCPRRRWRNLDVVGTLLEAESVAL